MSKTRQHERKSQHVTDQTEDKTGHIPRPLVQGLRYRVYLNSEEPTFLRTYIRKS